MSFHRRGFLGRLLSGGAVASSTALASNKNILPGSGPSVPPQDTGPRAEFFTPDMGKLAHRLIDGVKEFHLTAEVVTQEIAPGRMLTGWGYNGSIPGPTMEVEEGDRVRVVFHNQLPEPTAVHWHGFEVPHTQDGSVGLGQDPTPPGGMHVYEFTLNQTNTCFYHSHFPMQEMMGQIGFFLIHPKKPHMPRVDRDFGLILQEWDLRPNNPVPNSLAMEYNWLTFNGKSGPDCTPMIVRQGERVRVRMINMGMDHHPIHLHGFQFVMTGTEGGRVPEVMWYPQNTILVGVAQAREIEFDASHIGDWMLHCHLPHHMMNNMFPMVGPLAHGGGAAAGGHGGHQHGAGASAGGASAGSTGAAGGASPGSMGHASAGDVGNWPVDDPERKKVPGYPQDMWMPDDAPFQHKPENYGLRKTWSAAMGGMMTMIRVVPPDVYAKIEELRKQAPAKPKPGAHQHNHTGGAE